MRRSGSARLYLHKGHCPPWLFKRMRSMGAVILDILYDELGPEGIVEKLSDTYFFQSLSNVLGFDFNSSGTTTVLCGVLGEVFGEGEYGVAVAGGKGQRSRQTPQDIVEIGKRFDMSSEMTDSLTYCSRSAAKVDQALIQSGYDLYHHCVFITEDGFWSIVQQGMNAETKGARRYHWLGEDVDSFVVEPHKAIACDEVVDSVLDLTSSESRGCQQTIVDLVADGVGHLRSEYEKLSTATHYDCPRRVNWKSLEAAQDLMPESFEQLLPVAGLGTKTIRALALISELCYGSSPSWRDPARYSFAFGGKDGVPYPVDRSQYDAATGILEDAVRQSRLGAFDKIKAIRRLGLG